MLDPSTLARLSELKEATAPTDLLTIFTLFSKSTRECRLDLNQGLLALYDYLAPISITKTVKKYPSILEEWTLPDMAYTWELHELAAVLSGQLASFSSGAYAHGLSQTRLYERALYILWQKELLPSYLKDRGIT